MSLCFTEFRHKFKGSSKKFLLRDSETFLKTGKTEAYLQEKYFWELREILVPRSSEQGAQYICSVVKVI